MIPHTCQCDERLLDFLKEPRTMPDVVEERIVYRKKREPKEFYDFGEEEPLVGTNRKTIVRL